MITECSHQVVVHSRVHVYITNIVVSFDRVDTFFILHSLTAVCTLFAIDVL